MDELKILPHWLDTEQSTLWAVFIDPDVINILLPLLRL